MKKITFLAFICLSLSGCIQPITEQNNYRLEKLDGYEIPVCVNRPTKVRLVKQAKYDVNTCGNWVLSTPEEYEILDGECDTLQPEIVSYNYCLERLPKPVHLVEKKKDDMTICYDRNNKVELPILYCQKDMISIQNVNTSTYVIQRTNVSQRMTLY